MPFSFSNSFMGQMQGAWNKLRDLKGQLKNGILTEEQYADAAGAAGSDMAGSIMGGVSSGLSGLSSIIGGMTKSMEIADTSEYHNQIDDLSRLGSGGYSSYDQIMSDYGQLNSINLPDLQAIRGMSDGEKAGSVISSTLTGASTGLTVGGPWGAAAGAVVGLGAGLAGVFAGDAKARNEQKGLMLDMQFAQNNAKKNLDSALESQANYQFRSGLSHVARDGGKISRQQSLEEFAARALRKPKVRASEPRSFVRQHTEGGTMIRFKR